MHRSPGGAARTITQVDFPTCSASILWVRLVADLWHVWTPRYAGRSLDLSCISRVGARPG